MRFRIVERSALELIGSPPRKAVGYLSDLADTDNRSRTGTSDIDPRSILPGAVVSGNRRRVASSVSTLRPDMAPAGFDPRCMSPLLAHRDISLRCRTWSQSGHSGHEYAAPMRTRLVRCKGETLPPEDFSAGFGKRPFTVVALWKCRTRIINPASSI